MRSAEDQLKARLIPKDALTFNYNLFFAKDSDIDTVLDCVRTHPMMSKWRLVILRDVEVFSGFEKKWNSFLNKSLKNTCFIMETGKKSNDKFIKMLSKFAVPVIFSRLQGYDLKKWINQYLQARKRRISQAATILLLERIGSELTPLANAMDMLCAYTQDSKQINEADVEVLVGRTRPDTRFDFLNALTNKKVDTALTMANELSRGGRNVTDIIGLINWQFKRIESVKRFTQEGSSREEIGRILSLSPYVIDIIQRQSTRFSEQELDRGFRLLLESDLDIKQGRKAPLLTLETLIVRLCTHK